MPLIFSQCYRNNPHLPSFPTRRSSDLARFVTDTFGLPTITDILTELDKPGRDPRPEFKTATFADGVEKIGRGSRPRSEEHTSELQSLRHLVCRLLLEKKKRELLVCRCD